MSDILRLSDGENELSVMEFGRSVMVEIDDNGLMVSLDRDKAEQLLEYLIEYVNGGDD